MKKIDIINAAAILGSIAINKVKKDSVKTPLLLDYLKLHKASQAYKDEQKALIDKFNDDFADEITAVNKLRVKRLPVEGHDAFLKAEMDINKCIEKLLYSECSVEGLTLIPLADFAEAVADTDLSFEKVGVLVGIVIE